MFSFYKNLSIDCRAVTAAHFMHPVFYFKVPPIPWPEADRCSFWYGKLALKNEEHVFAHGKHIIVAEPAYFSVATNVIQKFLTFCRSVEIEEFLHTGTGEVFRLQFSGAVENDSVDVFSKIFLNEVVPHCGHGWEYVHAQQCGFIVLWERHSCAVILQSRDECFWGSADTEGLECAF